MLIADLSGRMSQNCSPGPDVFGEIWLRMHEELVIVYWETWEVLREKNAECEKSAKPSDLSRETTGDSAFWESPAHNSHAGTPERRK